MPAQFTDLYDGQIQLRFTPGRHRYATRMKDSEEWVERVSVTGILKIIDKPALVPWAANTCAEYVRTHLRPGQALDEVEIEEFAETMRREWRRTSKRAADIGTVAHRYAEGFGRVMLGEATKEPAWPVNEYAKRACEAFRKWIDKHRVEFLSVEQRIYSREHEYAGTVDLLAVVDGVETLCDYKSSKAIYQEYGIQTAGYRRAVLEEGRFSPVSELVLRFDKETGEFEPSETDKSRMQLCDRAFLAALDLTRCNQQIKAEIDKRKAQLEAGE